MKLFTYKKNYIYDNFTLNYFLMIIPWAKPLINKQDIQYLNEAANSQWIAMGKYVQNFEKRLKKFLLVISDNLLSPAP